MEETLVRCPYCWSPIEPPIDPEDEGEMIVDCEVCCQPMRVWVQRDEEGRAELVVDRPQ